MSTATYHSRLMPKPALAGVVANRPNARTLARVAFFFLWLLVFTIPWENVIVVPQIGTVAHLVGYIAFAIGALAVLDRGRLQATSSALALVFVFAFWRTASYFWTASPELTLIEIETI